MAEIHEHADSLYLYLTGAASDGAAQTSPDAALGNYRSSTREPGMTVSRASSISNLTVDYVSPQNGAGNGTLTATGNDTVTWTAPGESAGANVTILNGETKVIEGATLSKYAIVSRTSASNLTGTETDTLSYAYGNVVGFDNLSSAEASAGDNEYRALMLKNQNAATITGVTAYVKTTPGATQQVSDSAQLGASGAGTVITTGSFATWPASGCVHIRTSGGSTREIAYYTSRTGTSLTIPAAGRGLGGTSAGAGANTDLLDSVPPIRIGKEAPVSSAIQTIADESTAPTGISWNNAITAAGGVSIGSLAAGALYGLWIHRFYPASSSALASVVDGIAFNFDAP